MKAKVLKRLIALVMSALLMLGASVSAFATDVPSDVSTNLVETSDSSSDATVPTRRNTNESGICPARGQLTLYPTLDPYIGLKKTLYITVYVPSLDVQPSNGISVTVYKPDGNPLTSFFAYPREEEYSGEFTLPSSGTYRVVFKSNTIYEFFCTACWIE